MWALSEVRAVMSKEELSVRLRQFQEASKGVELILRDMSCGTGHAVPTHLAFEDRLIVNGAVTESDPVYTSVSTLTG